VSDKGFEQRGDLLLLAAWQALSSSKSLTHLAGWTSSSFLSTTSLTDNGTGRVRASSGDMPNSTGGYRGEFTFYDVMGRVSQRFNPYRDGWQLDAER
jgi:hypothetical protein